jgi:chemotaxis protein methyltransferase CheR
MSSRTESRVRLPEPLDGSDYEYVKSLVREHTAIALDDTKQYLVNARLLPVARAAGLSSVLALIRNLREIPYEELHWQAVEAIITTETSFFRDFFPFEALRQEVIPQLMERRRGGNRTLTIWSAGCSSGQEPFSVAMMLREAFPELASWTVRLLASDVSRAMLERAKSGVYSQIEVNRGLPTNYLVKYFRQQDTTWRINDDIRRMVTFFHHNLGCDDPTLPSVDVVMMRNVLIYFDVDTKRSILERVRRRLHRNGLLMLGTAETTLNLDERYQRLRIGRAVFYGTDQAEAR